MVEIRYKGNYEVADLAGKSLADVRHQYKERFGIPDKAGIRLNDAKIKPHLESEVKLRDADEVSFAEAKIARGALLAGALLVALAVTGGVFASGYLTNTVTLGLVTSGGGDFASVAPATGQPSWKVFGNQKGTITPGNLFTVSTQTAADNYTGNLAVTVSVANGDQLVKVYRVLSMFIQVFNSIGGQVDINSDNVVTAEDAALLTLNNGEVSLYIDQWNGSDNYTIKASSGYFVSNVYPNYSAGLWPSNSWQPLLYANVTQR